MRQRAVVWTEVIEVLRMGSLPRRPEPNPVKGSLERRMQRYVAGRELAVVVALSDDDPDVVVVTVIDDGRS